MSFGAGPSHIPSSASSSFSSSSSDDFMSVVANEIANANANAEEDMIVRLHATNNLLIGQYLNCIEENETIRGGSVYGHSVINRDREAANQRLWADYFSENPRYNEATFRRRFRMGRSLFLRIVNAIASHDNYFLQRRDGVGKLRLSMLQKTTAALRMLAYGQPADSTDEYVKIGESTAIESMKRFCRVVVEVFGNEYLRSPNANDVARLLQIGEKRGFPGMLGSLDCMHWVWKNCPTAWAGQYRGHSGTPTIILEAVADCDLWIWHAHFGLPGSNNDINVLEASNLFANLAKGIAPPAHYVIQGKEYNVGYYLVDGIYPKWSTLVQSITDPQGPKKRFFAMKQESCRKDVERAFGVLQSRFAIIKGPCRFLEKNVLHDIMSVCIIMHNMIVEDERVDVVNVEVPNSTHTTDVEVIVDETTRFKQFLARHRKIKDKEAHYALRNALIDHLWDQFSNSSS